MQDNDLELVARVRRGDKAAFSELARRHVDSMLAMAYSLVGSLPDAEDVVQETFIVALRRLDSFEGRSAFGTWLRGILVFKAAKLRRSRKVRDARPLQEHDGSSEAFRADAGIATPSTASAVESRIDVMQMLDTLSPEHRQIVVLRELEQHSYDEISDMLGIPIGTVESRLYRARQELRKRFGKNFS